MRLRVAPEAAAELKAAKQWYDGQRKGLGGEFVASVHALLTRVRSTPSAFPLLPSSADLRRAVVERFPYLVIFLVQENSVHVLAVAHQSRRPEYWRDRVLRRQK